MSKARLIITAVVVEGRSKSEVARDYGVSRQWVHHTGHSPRRASGRGSALAMGGVGQPWDGKASVCCGQPEPQTACAAATACLPLSVLSAVPSWSC